MPCTAHRVDSSILVMKVGAVKNMSSSASPKEVATACRSPRMMRP